jgi:hypothetical protein
MERFYFHVITGTSRYEDGTGTMLGSLADVMLHGGKIARVLGKRHAARINVAPRAGGEDYLEIEDQKSKFLITLPFERLLRDTSQHAKRLSDPIDLSEHRLARHYAGVRLA